MLKVPEGTQAQISPCIPPNIDRTIAMALDDRTLGMSFRIDRWLSTMGLFLLSFSSSFVSRWWVALQ